jgi:hypothetical protein
VLLAVSASLTAVGQGVITTVCSTPCGKTAKPTQFFSLTEAFCIQLGVANSLGFINAASMVRVDKGRQAGTVVTMDANNLMDQNRPRTGYRIDLQHYNTNDPDTRVNKCCNFHVQTNVGPNGNSLSIASVHIQVGVPFAPSYVMDAFQQSMAGRRPVMLLA